jgi:plasmid stabilization system protein ParE
MKGIVEEHGGSVEKFIGDAVMAVLGLPAVHEDDALRACRAAVEMREAFPALGDEGRIGLSTGEVVTGTEERLATGDALNVAARLQQACEQVLTVARLDEVDRDVRLDVPERLHDILNACSSSGSPKTRKLILPDASPPAEASPPQAATSATRSAPSARVVRRVGNCATEAGEGV